MQPFPRGPYAVEMIGDVPRIVDRFGNDVLREPNGMQRLVDCANALSDVWFPLNHVPATEDYIKRLEVSRREAWAAANMDGGTVVQSLQREPA
jgi:hypothetical protein